MARIKIQSRVASAFTAMSTVTMSTRYLLMTEDNRLRDELTMPRSV